MTLGTIERINQTIMKKLIDFSDMFIPRHSAFEKEENVEGATKWIIAFCIFLVVGILLANHFNFHIQ